MRNQKVYDLPMRLFHWVFAGLFVAAFLIAKTVDDESPLFSYHMLAGLTLGFVVGLRILWGFVGGQNSRFTSFALNPGELVGYLKGVLAGDGRKWGGHNPASSWAALLMFALALGLGITGYLMTSGQKETFEDVHELLANGFLVVVLLHVAGVILHGFRHQDAIALSMLDGRKKGVPAEHTISRSHGAVAAVFMVLVIGFATHLYRNYDGATRKLNLFGTTLTLGEEEESEHQQQNESEKGDLDGDDD